MPDDESWRSQDATAYLDRVQRAGFAWEFLRRNPDYRDDYEHMSRHLPDGTTIALEAALALAQRWGLSFPVRPAAAERPGTGTLGNRCSSVRDFADVGPAWDGQRIQLRPVATGDVRRGTWRRTSHSVAGVAGRTADLDSSGRESNRSGRRRHPVRYARPAAGRSRPSPVATPDGCCGAANRLAPDQTAAPPHDFDAEGA
jgi:hypothetical protein